MTGDQQGGAWPPPYSVQPHGFPAPAPPTLADGGGYPCDPAVGDISVAGLGPVRAAGIGRRLSARIIDWIVQALLFVLFAVPIAALASAMDEPDPSGWYVVLVLASFAFMMLAPPAYEIALTAKYGATLGKMALGIRVVRLADGRLPGAGTSFMRILLPVCAGLVCGIGTFFVYLSPLFDKSPALQGGHDMVAKTMVIRTR